MEKIKFHISLSGEYATEAPQARVKINDKIVFENKVTETAFISFSEEFDNESDNQLSIELFNKKSEHTEIDEQGNIVKDSVIKIKSVLIEDIEIHNNFSVNQEKFYYEHSGQQHQLYDTLGVNGKAVINFSTPFYVWLLETI